MSKFKVVPTPDHGTRLVPVDEHDRGEFDDTPTPPPNNPTPPGSHTPGPWSVSDGLVRLEDQIDQLLRDIGSDKEWVPVVIHDREGECGVTALCHPVNARLIAAAPELLELAKFMVLNIGGYDPEKARDMARAAIAKATGGAV